MRSVALSVVFVVLLTVGAIPIVATSSVATAGEAVAPSDPPSLTDQRYALQQPTESKLQIGTDSRPSTTFAINLQSDRSADWEVTVEYQLTTASEREAFREVAAGFEDGSATGGLDISLYENIAALSAEQTGRAMEVQSVERSSSLQGETGTLRLAFTWTEFLDTDGESLIFNDALNTPNDDSWLSSLGENQELRITTPRGYAITSASVGFSDNTVVITGPHTFDSEDHVRIIFEPSSFGPSWELLAAAVVIAVAITGGALLLRRQEEVREPQSQMDTNGGVDTVEQSAETPPPETDPEPADTADADPEPEEDLSLLADDERVLRLLERNGGRMRQAAIVSETKWSDAKVSQLLSAMADDDEIKKLRIGRENLISLPHIDALDGSVNDDDE